jgi:hypothetical protein
MNISPFQEIFKSNIRNNFGFINNAQKSERYNIFNYKNNYKIDINYDVCNYSEKNLDLTITSNNKLIAPTNASSKFEKSFDNKIYDYESMKNSSNYFYLDSIKEENDYSNFKELKSNLRIKKKKVGRKKKLDYEDNQDNHKIVNDNMIRKCKYLVINNCIEFLNYQIRNIYHNDIGEGILMKKILDINQQQKSDNKLETTKLFLNKRLIDIFSVDISPKYTSFLPAHNSLLISRLLNEEDIEKRKKFEKIFNLTFADCIQLFLGNNSKFNGLEGFPVFDEIKGDLNENDKFLEKLKNYLINFEDIIKNKKPRKRNKKESSENDINKKNQNEA